LVQAHLVVLVLHTIAVLLEVILFFQPLLLTAEVVVELVIAKLQQLAVLAAEVVSQVKQEQQVT
jgi:hypothetical protein